MGKAQGYLVSIKGPEGLQEPRGENHKEIARQKRLQHLRDNGLGDLCENFEMQLIQ
jgi:hypothetical protein